jgi:hypothetical protein
MHDASCDCTRRIALLYPLSMYRRERGKHKAADRVTHPVWSNRAVAPRKRGG